jgi:periplasmic protein TonB
MRRVRAACAPWLGSLVVHGALVALLWPSSRPPHGDAELDVISVDEIVEEAVEEALEDIEPDPGGGGAVDRDVAGREPARTETAPRRHAAERAEPAPIGVVAISSATARARSLTREAPRAGGGDGGHGGGVGGGIGAGRGRGSGGVGSGRGGAPLVRATRPARSKARPPRLVYPRRDREERPGEVFVVLLTVNEKGYVVGVRLKQGVSPSRDEKALEAVWRFHYDPALDHAGRPIQAKVVQRFMVE